MKLIGDLNQRYEVSSFGYPNEGWTAIGWSDNLTEAEYFERQVKIEPGCTATTIRERKPKINILEELMR